MYNLDKSHTQTSKSNVLRIFSCSESFNFNSQFDKGSLSYSDSWDETNPMMKHKRAHGSLLDRIGPWQCVTLQPELPRHNTDRFLWPWEFPVPQSKASLSARPRGRFVLVAGEHPCLALTARPPLPPNDPFNWSGFLPFRTRRYTGNDGFSRGCGLVRYGNQI